MDEIRRALGEEKLSYLGYSYGTYLGAVYASLFPERTDRIVLDSSVNPFGAWRNVFRGFGHGGEVRFPDFAIFAAANDATYHLGDDRAGIGPLYFRLFDQLEADPIPLEPGVVLDGHLLQAFTFSALYSDLNFPVLAQVFQLLNEGLIARAGGRPAGHAVARPARPARRQLHRRRAGHRLRRTWPGPDRSTGTGASSPSTRSSSPCLRRSDRTSSPAPSGPASRSSRRWRSPPPGSEQHPHRAEPPRSGHPLPARSGDAHRSRTALAVRERRPGRPRRLSQQPEPLRPRHHHRLPRRGLPPGRAIRSAVRSCRPRPPSAA